jgi:TetR/AcrR family transcriptional regulator, transcriptional repressor of aconitase
VKKNKRRMTAQDRKLAIVKAALPLFARKGFAETTTRELARAAGVSEPLLYKHFPGKEALYDEIQNFCCVGKDSVAQRLADLKPSASTLVHLVYFLMRALVLGRPMGAIDWDTRHRLMLKSYLEDGVFARLLYRNRFSGFCAQIEACLDVATAAGEAVPGPVSARNRALFAHHLGAWLAAVHLPGKPTMDYQVSREELLHQAVAFVLRGAGLTDKAIATHYNPKALALSFADS